jgi:Fe-S cluster assembly scaffold protein SufB
MAAAVTRYDAWLDAEQLRALSRSRSEPVALTERRLEAHRQFLELPLEPDPLYRKYGYFSGVELAGLNAMPNGPSVGQVEPAPRTIGILHDATGSTIDLPEELRAEGVRVETLDEIVRAETAKSTGFFDTASKFPDRLSAFAIATVNRGYRLSLPSKLRAPVRLRDVSVLSTPHEALSVRRHISTGSENRLLVSEEILSTQADPGHQRFLASSTELRVGDDSHAVYLTLHAPDTQAVSVNHRGAEVGRAGNLTWVWAGFGGFRTKARGNSTLLGQGSILDDLQAFYGAGKQAYDSGITLTHVGTDTHGQSITRGVFADDARGMSRGLVRIEKEARRTLSFLSEHAMLLSRGARSDTVPILEILCRDVKATHSSSVAPVDPERVFYLESRGVSRSDAVRLIGEGFLSHVLERAPVHDLREILYPYLAARWEGRPVLWGSDGVSALPPLEFAAGTANADWRFDAKLR